MTVFIFQFSRFSVRRREGALLLVHPSANGITSQGVLVIGTNRRAALKWKRILLVFFIWFFFFISFFFVWSFVFLISMERFERADEAIVNQSRFVVVVFFSPSKREQPPNWRSSSTNLLKRILNRLEFVRGRWQRCQANSFVEILRPRVELLSFFFSIHCTESSSFILKKNENTNECSRICESRWCRSWFILIMESHFVSKWNPFSRRFLGHFLEFKMAAGNSRFAALFRAWQPTTATGKSRSRRRRSVNLCGPKTFFFVIILRFFWEFFTPLSFHLASVPTVGRPSIFRRVFNFRRKIDGSFVDDIDIGYGTLDIKGFIAILVVSCQRNHLERNPYFHANEAFGCYGNGISWLHVECLSFPCFQIQLINSGQRQNPSSTFKLGVGRVWMFLEIEMLSLIVVGQRMPSPWCKWGYL